MNLLETAKRLAELAEEEARRMNVPITISVVDIHGNIVLKHRMAGALLISIEMSERKAYPCVSESSKAEEVILPEIRFLTPAELDSLRANAEELKKKFEHDSWTKTRRFSVLLGTRSRDITVQTSPRIMLSNLFLSLGSPKLRSDS
jgi:Haem-degrading